MAIHLTSLFLLGGLPGSPYRTNDELTSNLHLKWAINCGYKPNNCVSINNLRNLDLNNLAPFGLRRSSRMLIISWTYHPPLKYIMCYEHRPLGKRFKRHVTVGTTPDRFK